jgi:transcriptional regulator with XRE-family HTH domain
MPARTRARTEASRHGAWLVLEAGRELRLARHNAGLTERQLAARLGWSTSKVSRIERGLARNGSIRELAALGSLVGLRLSVRLYPAGAALRDAGQLELLAALNVRMHTGWATRHEVAMPRPGDLRAADQVSIISGCSVMVEAYRVFTDAQAQVRSARLKQAELGADRLVLLLEDTHRNRGTLASARPELERSFPVRQRPMLAALARGRDPGGDGIVVLRRHRAATLAPSARNPE